MKSHFMTYSIIVALLCSLASWTGLARRAMGGQGSGNSWHSSTSGPGYYGGWLGGRRGRRSQMNGIARVGSHILADFYGVDPKRLRDGQALEALLRAAAEAAGARILSSHFHSFGEAHGVTGVVMLSESHISIHTWPESGFAAADIFMCGSANPQRALSCLEASLVPTRQHVETAARG